MIWEFILVCVAFLLFIVYNAIALAHFKPINVWSMSRTYYLYEWEKTGHGWFFSIFMWLMALMLVPGWSTIAFAIGSWMKWFAFLAPATCACIMFVGGAPRYYKDAENPIHMRAAKICAGTALVWCALASWDVYCIPMLVGVSVAAIIGACIKDGWKECSAYWLEMMAFDATFATVITEFIKHLL